MRSKRKLRTDMELKTSGGIFDLIDNFFKEIYFVNDTELPAQFWRWLCSPLVA